MQKIHALGKPIVAVLINGKPLVLADIEDCCNAIVESFNGGDLGGLAVAKLLKGEENFSGKLPISFPRAVGMDPSYYNQYEYWHSGQYIDVKKGESYPFGFGLSYSRFEITAASLSSNEAKKGGKVALNVEIANQSEVDGKETVQVYFKDKVCKILTPVRQLIDFKKVEIAAGKKERVSFEIAVDDLGYYDKNCQYQVDEGDFDIFVSIDGKNFEKLTLRVV